MDYYKHLRIIALNSVISPDEPYLIRKIVRWYSKTFSTPISVVEEIPLEHILTAYYESEFEDKKEEELEQIIQDMFADDVDNRKEEMAEEKRAVEDYEFLKALKEEQRLNPKKDLKGSLNDLVKASKKLTNAFNSVKANRETILPEADSLPSNVSISFSDDLEEEIERHDLSLFNDIKKSK